MLLLIQASGPAITHHEKQEAHVYFSDLTMAPLSLTWCHGHPVEQFEVPILGLTDAIRAGGAITLPDDIAMGRDQDNSTGICTK